MKVERIFFGIDSRLKQIWMMYSTTMKGLETDEPPRDVNRLQYIGCASRSVGFLLPGVC